MTYAHDWRRFRPKKGGLVGILSARTDADTGEITMSSANHPVETGDTVDVSWAGGSRTDMTVGTVSGTTVPIDGGSGDDLPSTSTPVTVVVGPSTEPTTLGELSPFGWWDFSNAATITTYIDGSITRISEITDGSGNGNSLLRDGTNRGAQTNMLPTFDINGRDTALFSNGYLICDFGVTKSQPFTYVWVGRTGSDTPLQMNWWDGRKADPNRANFYKAPSGGGDSFSLYAGTAFNSGFTPIAADETFIAMGIFNGASSKIIVNESNVATGNPGSGTVDGVTMGAKWDQSGVFSFLYMGEAAFFDRAMSDSEVDDVFSVLNAKWAVY